MQQPLDPEYAKRLADVLRLAAEGKADGMAAVLAEAGYVHEGRRWRVTNQEAAELCGVVRKTLWEWRTLRGFPPLDAQELQDLREVVKWWAMQHSLARGGLTDEEHLSPERQARLALIRERTELARLERGVLEGRLVDAGERMAEEQRAIHDLKHHLLDLGRRVSMSTDGLTGQALQEHVEAQVAEALGRLEAAWAKREMKPKVKRTRKRGAS